MTRTDLQTEDRPQRRPLRALLPLAIFAGIAAMFYVGLFWSTRDLPSALIDKPVPEFDLPALQGLADGGKAIPGFASKDLARGDVSVVNVWASWCIPCHQEHPFLSVLAEKGEVPLFGLNYKDQAAAARRFLGHYGNPFKAVGTDGNGRVAINWGVYGVPETFVVSGQGRIVYKHVGPINAKVIDERLLPAIRKARGEG